MSRFKADTTVYPYFILSSGKYNDESEELDLKIASMMYETPIKWQERVPLIRALMQTIKDLLAPKTFCHLTILLFKDTCALDFFFKQRYESAYKRIKEESQKETKVESKDGKNKNENHALSHSPVCSFQKWWRALDTRCYCRSTARYTVVMGTSIFKPRELQVPHQKKKKKRGQDRHVTVNSWAQSSVLGVTLGRSAKTILLKR